jgi:hypothetical protein
MRIEQRESSPVTYRKDGKNKKHHSCLFEEMNKGNLFRKEASKTTSTKPKPGAFHGKIIKKTNRQVITLK